MSEKNVRKCLACGQEHPVDMVCPIVQEKIRKHDKFKNKNFLLGNIILECIERKVDFYQTLLEIAEFMRVFDNNAPALRGLYMNPELFLEYFAVSLKCSSSAFIRKSEYTVHSYASLISSKDLYSNDVRIRINENNLIDCITWKVDIDYPCNLIFKDIYNFNLLNAEYEFYLKLEDDGDKWKCSLCLEIPEAISYHKKEKLDFSSLTICYLFNMDSVLNSGFELVSDFNGELMKICMDEVNNHWTTYCSHFPYEDVRCKLWTDKLINATLDGLIEWKKINKSYQGQYADSEIILCVNVGSEHSDNELLYIKNVNGTNICFGRDYEPWVEIYSYKKELTMKDAVYGEIEDDNITPLSNPRLVKLAKYIDKDIVKKEYNGTLSIKPNLASKKINIEDVLVITHSMFCKNNNHTIVPYKGIVPLLNNDNKEIRYEIYLGFCQQCYTYMMFKEDYELMLMAGTPLCKVYTYEEAQKKNMFSGFKYKSQSVLHAMGYNVQENNSLTQNDRRKILKKALDTKAVKIQDLLNFLSWLIRTRESQPKYKNAVSRWKSDMMFVEQYKVNERKEKNVTAIKVKSTNKSIFRQDV